MKWGLRIRVAVKAVSPDLTHKTEIGVLPWLVNMKMARDLLLTGR